MSKTLIVGMVASAAIALAPTANAQPSSEQCSTTTLGSPPFMQSTTDCYSWDGYNQHHTSKTICDYSGSGSADCRTYNYGRN